MVKFGKKILLKMQVKELEDFIEKRFGISVAVFLQALRSNPSANGYLMGAISELLLRQYLESLGYEVLRIKEKPSGGNEAKNSEARGDFYIRKQGEFKNEWLVVECKGLKSNSEFRGSKLDSKDKLFRFLKPLAFPAPHFKQKIYDKGFKAYAKAKDEWSKNNPNKLFPSFEWSLETAGAINAHLQDIWQTEDDLRMWIYSQPDEFFTEQAYRKAEGVITILETHQPSKRIGEVTQINQAAPLVKDFNIMAVDLFLRTGKHEFAFMNSEKISHSPTSPEHLYQNYTIDILVKGKKTEVIFTPPWYSDIEQLIKETKPAPRKIDESQLDRREDFREFEN
jgi:hypothetical protein